MFRLAKLGVLPSILLDLKDDLTLFASCMFEASRRSQCISKGKKSGYTIKENDNEPWAAIPVDQLQSDHPGLFPKTIRQTHNNSYLGQSGHGGPF